MFYGFDVHNFDKTHWERIFISVLAAESNASLPVAIVNLPLFYKLPIDGKVSMITIIFIVCGVQFFNKQKHNHVISFYRIKHRNSFWESTERGFFRFSWIFAIRHFWMLLRKQQANNSSKRYNKHAKHITSGF